VKEVEGLNNCLCAQTDDLSWGYVRDIRGNEPVSRYDRFHPNYCQRGNKRCSVHPLLCSRSHTYIHQIIILMKPDITATSSTNKHTPIKSISEQIYDKDLKHLSLPGIWFMSLTSCKSNG